MSSKDRFLVLLRHGIAEDRSDSVAEFDRRLTDEGKRRVRKVARALVRVFPEADTIYSSPLRRCIETAEIVAAAYDGKLEPIPTDALTPATAAAAFRELLAAAGGENIICVGHEPSLSEFMLDLAGCGPAGRASLKKGGVYGLRLFASGEAQLEWMAPPKLWEE